MTNVFEICDIPKSVDIKTLKYKMINYLKNNNQSVFNLLKKNKLPQRNEFLKSLYEVIQ